MTDPIEQRLGDVVVDGNTVSLRFVRNLNHPPEKVWRALTESDQLQHWFPADIIGERRPGAALRLPFWPESVDQAAAELESAGVDLAEPVLTGTLLTWDPPRVFEFTWDTDVLRFELTPNGPGTRLAFTNTAGGAGPRGLQGTLAGYHVCFDSLAEALDTGSSTIPSADEIEALEQRYATLPTLDIAGRLLSK